MKLAKYFVYILFFFIGGLILGTNKVHASPTFTYPDYTVDININKDSTFTVKESFIYQFYGTVHGVRRDIKTKNNSCFSQSQYTCGGFNRLEMLGVYDENDRKLDSSQFTTSTYEDQDTGDQFYRVERVLYPNGQEFNGEKVRWSIEYKVYGGLKWFGENPIFYWNVIPDDMGGDVDKAEVNIHLPSGTDYKSENFQIYDDYGKDPSISFQNNTVVMDMVNLGSTGALTVSYTFQPDEIIKPGSISYSIQNPQFGNVVWINGVKVDSVSTIGLIDNVPAGNFDVRFEHLGYETYELTGVIASSENKNISVNLQPTSWMSVILFLNTVLTCLGIFSVPAGIIYVFLNYRKKGVDKNMPKTIIPLFKPPVDTPPYLLGTIKDERVDKEDIVGSIIDLAYRGYIKVKEITKGSNYELTRLGGKAGDSGLNPTETVLMDSIFKGGDQVTTSKMRNYFYTKYMLLRSLIYGEVVKKGFFTRSPEQIRSMYVGCGIFFLIVGIVGFCLFSVFGTPLLGYIILCTPLLGLITLGLGFALASKFMPAKTEKGSKIYADILGFKMYLNTAERYRLQNLEPEDFEKYLSYAIVFGIEKQWAEKFKDIYKKMPDWYEGSYNGTWNAIWVSNFTRSFADSTIVNMSPAPSSGTSGGGWGGSSGSFGGFSGGGGGGGSSGGF